MQLYRKKPNDIPVICLMGATATGKTDAAAQVFDQFDAEIISVADFYNDTLVLIERITNDGKVPVLAGGTMFYFNALEHGLTDLPKADKGLREQIDSDAEKQGWPKLHEKLASLDPQSAKRIDPMDAQRIQRALEIVLSSGKTVAEHNGNRKSALPNPLVKIALSFSDRAVLHERIERRFDIMLEQGLQAEVEGLLASGVDADTTAMKMIGYRQMLDFLEDKMTYEDMRFKGIVATRQLAKRQLTWLRNQKNLIWWVDKGLKNKQFQPLMALIEEFL